MFTLSELTEEGAVLLKITPGNRSKASLQREATFGDDIGETFWERQRSLSFSPSKTCRFLSQ